MTAPLPRIRQAFVLGAGLGTRLRPLTEELPKPLVPIFQKPLITFAFDHLLDLGVERFLVNTHHQPQQFAAHFPDGTYRERAVTFHHEPILLETAGGIANVAEALDRSEPFLVYNGDTLTDLPLAPLLAEHFQSGNLVTLALRSSGGPLHVAFDQKRGRILDLRNLRGTGDPGQFLFTGIYVVDPGFLQWIRPGVKQSVIPIFLELIGRGEKLGGVVIDDGHWWDVGTRQAYLELHRELPQLDFPRHPIEPADWRAPVHPTARVHPSAVLRGQTVLGRDVSVGEGALVQDCIAWPGAEIRSQSRLRNCIIRARKKAGGDLRDQDI